MNRWIDELTTSFPKKKNPHSLTDLISLTVILILIFVFVLKFKAMTYIPNPASGSCSHSPFTHYSLSFFLFFFLSFFLSSFLSSFLFSPHWNDGITRGKNERKEKENRERIDVVRENEHEHLFFFFVHDSRFTIHDGIGCTM